MKKFTKKILAFCVLVAMSISMMTMTVSAEGKVIHQLSEKPPISASNPGEISTYDWMVPTRTWNLSTEGIYFFDGNANKTPLYTNYLFTGTTQIDITVNNRLDTEVNVTLYRLDDSEDILFGTKKIGSFTVGGKTAIGKAFKVESDKEYYFSFSKPCDVYGHIG